MQETEARPKVKMVLLLVGLIALGYLILSRSPDYQGSSSSGRDFTLLSFDDFDNMIGGRDRMPPAQQQVLFAQYRGRYVKWYGEVHKCERTPAGDYLLEVRHRVDTDDFDVVVRLDRSDEQKLKRLSRGKAVSYIGRLDSFSPAMGYYLDKGEIE
jgi:hypothetical protein